MQFGGQKPPVGIIFDSDAGNTIDSTLALALLYGFEGKNEVRVVSTSVSKSSLHAAAFAEVLARFYMGAPSGDFGSFRRPLPMGMSDGGKSPEDTPIIDAVLSRKKDDGTLAYSHGIHKMNDTAEVPALLRNALTAQNDQNAIVVLAGPATNLVTLFDLPGTRELIAQKVRFLAVAAGAYPDGPADPHIKADLAAARKLFADWPGPIVACGRDLGDALPYPAASIEKDFAWSTAHPVVDAYKAVQPMPYDANSWDMAAVLYACHPQDGYFKLSDPGTISISADGHTKFTPTPAGKHRYLIFDPAQKERVLKVYTEMASAKPVVRAPRFPRPAQKKDAVEPAKPEAAKPESKKP